MQISKIIQKKFQPKVFRFFRRKIWILDSVDVLTTSNRRPKPEDRLERRDAPVDVGRVDSYLEKKNQ